MPFYIFFKSIDDKVSSVNYLIFQEMAGVRVPFFKSCSCINSNFLPGFLFFL